MTPTEPVIELPRATIWSVPSPAIYAADAATNALGEIADSGILNSSGQRGWKRFRARLYAPLLSRYGFDPAAGAYSSEAPERSQRRAQIVGKLIWTPRGKKIRQRLAEASEAFLAGETSALDSAWFGPAFNIRVRQGGEPAAKSPHSRGLNGP